MAHIAQDSLANLYFEFTWKSSHATHVERYLARNVSFTRDILPLGVKSRMRGLGEGDSVSMAMDMSEVPPFKPGKVLDMPSPRFIGPDSDTPDRPRIGRYYPKYYIEAVPGTRPDSTTPFRVVAVDKGGFKADLNHPMAGREVTIRATVMDIDPPTKQAGELNRWPDRMLQGPGMQARLPETPTDFLGIDDPFHREDESNDADFHATGEQGDLLDDQAASNIMKLHAELLEDGMEILDLMAGSINRIPETVRPGRVTGLGLNPSDMQRNTSLDTHVIHNLNEKPTLPFEDNTFDAVLCTLGVEYMTHPFEIFEEAARVLQPGGVCCMTFSSVWAEDKVTRVWTGLHPFERMGLVSQFFIRTDRFTDLHTWSERGWTGSDDTDSAPIYAVFATAR